MGIRWLTVALALTLLLALHVQPAGASHKSGFACVNEAGWSVCYATTNTDGIEIIHASWIGVENFRDMSLPQINVEYWKTPPSIPNPYYLVDQLGSQAINQPCGPISKTPISEPGGNYGFSLQQEFRTATGTCGQPPSVSYTFLQGYDFWSNGVMGAWLKIYGPGMADESRYHVNYVVDIDAYASRFDDNFEYFGIQSWQYPPYEHAYYDDGVYDAGMLEWRVRNAAYPYQGYTSRPWIWSAFGGPTPPFEARYWTFVYDESEDSTPETILDYPEKWFLNFPKAWDKDLDLAPPNNLVNWYQVTIRGSAALNYCKPSNHCGVGIWFTPTNQ